MLLCFTSYHIVCGPFCVHFMSNNFVFLSKMTVSLRLIIKTIIIDMLSLLVALDLFICLSSCEHYNFQTSVWYLWPVCLINLSLYALNLSSKKRISNFKKYLDEIYCTADHKLFTKNNSCSVPSHVWLGRFYLCIREIIPKLHWWVSQYKSACSRHNLFWHHMLPISLYHF